MKKFITKLPLWIAILLVSIFSCEQEDQTLSELQGSVNFVGIILEFAPIGSPGSQITENSTWVHVFPNSANLIFTNKATREQYVLEYFPKDFSKPYSITLPYGAYEYFSIEAGAIISEFLPFEARGEFILDSPSLEISMMAETDYGLVTVKDQYVEKASISDGKQESDLMVDQKGRYWFIYVKKETASALKVRESLKGSTIVQELSTSQNYHYNFILKKNEGAGAAPDLIMAPFTQEEEVASSSKFFEENGTIKCPEAIPGEKGKVNNHTYEAVDRALLIKRRDEGADLGCVCTSLVTDMSRMFYIKQNFNKNISTWDVSNVTDMSEMFAYAESFNQPIGNWDVNKVKDMSHMFARAKNFNQPIGNWNVNNVTDLSAMFMLAQNFNQPIGNWNVSNVEDINGMFAYATKFNNPIGNWDVSKVTNMADMFKGAQNFDQPIGNWDVSNVRFMELMFNEAHSFNQPIGNWNVSNVIGMIYMFDDARSFNQPIGQWDVISVNDMYRMFASANSFNQPIGNWNVSNVEDMSHMFYNTILFNQDLGNWCVQKIPVESENFSTGSALLNDHKPVWGTCPE